MTLLGHSGDQVLEKLARLRYARALSGLSACPGSRRVQRTGDREVHLGSCQPLACGWKDGNRDVMPDGVDTELNARLHRSPRSRGSMGAPDGGKPRKRNSGDHEGRGCMAPPPGYAHAHTVKLITPSGAHMLWAQTQLDGSPARKEVRRAILTPATARPGLM